MSISQSTCTLYMETRCCISLQTTDDARKFLQVFDPTLGKPLDEFNYAQDCRIYAPDHPDGPFANVMEKMDVFVASHFFGWWVKVSQSVRVSCVKFFGTSPQTVL